MSKGSTHSASAPDRTAEVIARTFAFRTVPEEEVREVARSVEVARYPAGHVVLRQGGPASEYLYVIEAGTVHVEASDPERPEAPPQLVDVCSEGELFGAASVLDDAREARARFTTRVVEEVTCYLLPREQVRRLVARYPAVADALASRNHRLLRRATAEIAARGESAALAQELGLGLRALLEPVSARVRRAVVTCAPEATIAEAARRMSAAEVSSLPVVTTEGRPAGIVTDSDLRRQVVAQGRAVSEPISAIMSQPVLTLAATAPALDALRLMSEHAINHLVVVDERGGATGVITSGDLMLLQQHGPVALLRAIEAASDLAVLAAARARTTGLLEELVGAGIEAEQATRLLTALNDRATCRALAWAEAETSAELAEETGAEVVPPRYCWLALGSEGRREQTLATDQDNALIHAAAPEDRIGRRWLERFAARAVAHLEQIGFPLCPGHVMASNPHWRRSAQEWEQQIARWIEEPDGQALLECAIFFDFRSLYGDASLVQPLQEQLRTQVARNEIFLAHLTASALRNRPPLGLLRTFVVERSGEHRNTLDLKERGMAPLVDAARVLALGSGVTATNTFQRLRAAAETRALSQELAEDAREAYAFLMLVRLQHHVALQAAGKPPDNHINPNQLSALQRRTLKVAFQVVQAVQEKLTARFGGYGLT